MASTRSLELRPLRDSDFASLVSLLQEQREFFGQPAESVPGLRSKAVLDRLLVNVLEQGDELVLGAFYGVELAGAALIKLSPRDSLWVIKLVVIREALKRAGTMLHAELLGYAIRCAEARGYSEFLTLVPAAHVSSAKTWERQPDRARYVGETVEVVEAGSSSTNLLHTRLLFDKEPHKIATAVRRFRLAS